MLKPAISDKEMIAGLRWWTCEAPLSPSLNNVKTGDTIYEHPARIEMRAQGLGMPGVIDSGQR
ncbi:MAG: hypothetical protein SVO26_07325 [Chloroflexota bacterium]|nr:hypothetical protein [Chloroflexota bacterium]